MRILFIVVLLGCCGTTLLNCGNPPAASADLAHQFTKADSLTDFYLSLQDSLHQVWNIMINDDNQKIESMHNLLHELMVSHPEELDHYKKFEERIGHLMRMRYTQKSMSNTDVIAEYDFASSTLVTELLAAIQSKKEYSYNETLQKLVGNIREADHRILHRRFEYDSIVLQYNRFVDKNKDYLKQTDGSLSVEKKPLFRIVSDK
jgi:hypothetical protein